MLSTLPRSLRDMLLSVIRSLSQNFNLSALLYILPIYLIARLFVECVVLALTSIHRFRTEQSKAYFQSDLKNLVFLWAGSSLIWWLLLTFITSFLQQLILPLFSGVRQETVYRVIITAKLALSYIVPTIAVLIALVNSFGKRSWLLISTIAILIAFSNDYVWQSLRMLNRWIVAKVNPIAIKAENEWGVKPFKVYLPKPPFPLKKDSTGKNVLDSSKLVIDTTWAYNYWFKLILLNQTDKSILIPRNASMQIHTLTPSEFKRYNEGSIDADEILESPRTWALSRRTHAEMIYNNKDTIGNFILLEPGEVKELLFKDPHTLFVGTKDTLSVWFGDETKLVRTYIYSTDDLGWLPPGEWNTTWINQFLRFDRKK